MSVKTLTPALLVLAGLLAGWAIWGRGPDLARIRADNAALAARVAARESTVAQLARLAVQLDVARHRAVGRVRIQRDTIRIEVARADSAQAAAAGQLAQGDSAGAIAHLTLATQLLDRALARCEASLDSLEQAATTTCDQARAADSAALAERARTIADQAERIEELTAELRPPRPWALGVVVSERLAPRGVSLSRDLGPLRLQGLMVRETVTDSLGRRREEGRGYLIGSLRF